MSSAGGADRGPRASVSPPASWRDRIPLLALILLGLVLYARGMVLSFVGDDLTTLDAALRLPLGDLMSARLGPPGPYRTPARELYFWWWGRTVGLGPGGFHLVNLISFAGAVVMLGRLASGFGGRRAGILTAALCVLFPPGSALLA
ncbi:MAG TPA: hypothetical protein VJY35_01280, partial [Candidatus Eisenbacteria bacterium]|nr:hypothetical protein [Candidatus Eisenbacteria bacterium]